MANHGGLAHRLTSLHMTPKVFQPTPLKKVKPWVSCLPPSYISLGNRIELKLCRFSFSMIFCLRHHVTSLTWANRVTAGILLWGRPGLLIRNYTGGNTLLSLQYLILNTGELQMSTPIYFIRSFMFKIQNHQKFKQI